MSPAQVDSIELGGKFVEVSKSEEVTILERGSARLACKAMKAVEIWSKAMSKFDYQLYKDWDGFHLLNEQAGRMNRLMREAGSELGNGSQDRIDKEGEGEKIGILVEKIKAETGKDVDASVLVDRKKVEEMYLDTVGKRIEKELDMMVSAVGGEPSDLDEAGNMALKFVGFDRERMSIVQDAVKGVVHEVGNPLAKVKGYLDMALEDAEVYEEVVPEIEKIPDYLVEAADAASLMTQILEGKLEGSETGGENVSQIFRTKLREYVGGIDTVKTVGSPNKELKVRYSKAVAQMLMGTMMQNVERYVLPGSTDRSKLEFVVGTEELQGEGGKFLEVSVEDNGPGYSDERIAEGFVTGGTGGKGEGTGMAFHRKLAQSLGGDLYPSKRKDGKPGARTVLRLAVV